MSQKLSTIQVIVELHISGKLRKTFVFDNMKKKRFGDLLTRMSKNVTIQ